MRKCRKQTKRVLNGYIVDFYYIKWHFIFEHFAHTQKDCSLHFLLNMLYHMSVL